MTLERLKILHTTWQIRYSMTYGKFYAVDPATNLKTGHFRTLEALKTALLKGVAHR